MTRLLKAAGVTLAIGLSLTSDTAQSASPFQDSRFEVQWSGQSSLMNSVAFAGTGQRPPSWVYRKSTPLPLTPLCGSTLK